MSRKALFSLQEKFVVGSKNARPVVLVVEDEPIILFATINAFETCGFEVVDASSADCALIALTKRPDVTSLFTDVHMPGRLNGIELAQLVHQNRPDIHVFLTSGVIKLEESQAPEGWRFIPKPFDSLQVAELIKERIALT